MMAAKLNRVVSEIATLRPQVATLAELLAEMRSLNSQTSTASLWRRLRELKAAERRRQRARSPETKSAATVPFNSHVSRRRGFHREAKCCGCCCPISLERIQNGVLAHGTCYEYESLRSLFKSQFDAGMHLHDPIIRAVAPEEFVTLKRLGLITNEMCDVLESRYPVRFWAPCRDPDRRFQLVRT